MNELIEKYKTVFAGDKYDICWVRKYVARVNLSIDKYCSKRYYNNQAIIYQATQKKLKAKCQSYYNTVISKLKKNFENFPFLVEFR